jgi:hypothetical protein
MSKHNLGYGHCPPYCYCNKEMTYALGTSGTYLRHKIRAQEREKKISECSNVA